MLHEVCLTIDQVALLLNDAFDSFVSRFPAFCGSVSIVAHSMGCSIIWELLSQTESASSSTLRWPLNFRYFIAVLLGSCNQQSQHIPLSVTNAFMIGSSLGGYLSLVSDPHRRMHVMRCVNIFHPLDPLAQRLEPWISPDIWAEALVSSPPSKLDFPLQNVPMPMSTSAFLERNASRNPHRFMRAQSLVHVLHHRWWLQDAVASEAESVRFGASMMR